MSDLRNKLARLAHQVPETRKVLVPMLREAAKDWTQDDFIRMAVKDMGRMLKAKKGKFSFEEVGRTEVDQKSGKGWGTAEWSGTLGVIWQVSLVSLRQYNWPTDRRELAKLIERLSEKLADRFDLEFRKDENVYDKDDQLPGLEDAIDKYTDNTAVAHETTVLGPEVVDEDDVRIDPRKGTLYIKGHAYFRGEEEYVNEPDDYDYGGW